MARKRIVSHIFLSRKYGIRDSTLLAACRLPLATFCLLCSLSAVSFDPTLTYRCQRVSPLYHGVSRLLSRPGSTIHKRLFRHLRPLSPWWHHDCVSQHSEGEHRDIRTPNTGNSANETPSRGGRAHRGSPNHVCVVVVGHQTRAKLRGRGGRGSRGAGRETKTGNIVISIVERNTAFIVRILSVPEAR